MTILYFELIVLEGLYNLIFLRQIIEIVTLNGL